MDHGFFWVEHGFLRKSFSGKTREFSGKAREITGRLRLRFFLGFRLWVFLGNAREVLG